MTSDLKTKTLSGMIWSFVQRFGTMIISFVSNIVLARLLTPDDYGTIGMLMIFIAVANTFVDGGFGSALIQKKEPTKEDYSTIFWWNMFLSLVLYGVLYVCAPAVARFYDLPLLSQVLRVQGLVLILNALSIIQQNQLRKQLKFKRLASVTVVSAVLSAGIAIVLAYKGWGVWALVAQQLMLSGFTAIILWVTNKWYPSLIFSKKSFKELFGFGGLILLSNLINTLCNNIQTILIGKFFTPSTLGYYTQARKLEEVASTGFSSVVDQVTYPILSENQNDIKKLRDVLRKLLMSIAYITMPVMAILALTANTVIILLYTDKWVGCIPYFQLLCIAGIAISMQGILYYAVASIGKSKELFRWTIIKRSVALFCVVLGMAAYGIYGLLVGTVIGAWTVYLSNAYLCVKHIGYSARQQMLDLLPIIIANIIAYIGAHYILQFINIHIYIDSLLAIVIYVGIYLVLSYLFKLQPLSYVCTAINKFIRK